MLKFYKSMGMLYTALCLSACGAAFQSHDFDPSMSTSANPYQSEQQRLLNKKLNPNSKDNDILLLAHEYELLKDQLLAQNHREHSTVSKDITDSEKVKETLAFCNSSDLGELKSQKKKEFVCSLLPDAIRMNMYVYKQRILVLSLKRIAAQNSLKVEEQTWLNQLKTAYSLDAEDSFEDVLTRVDIVPLPVLLAQAAIESGWGTSRASLQAKNYFGIHGAVGKDNCLLALKDPSVCIKKYNNIVEGIADYIEFLNTKRSAEKFRQVRYQLRSSGAVLDPFKLSATLTFYSGIGEQYIKQVNEMMTGQNFVKYTSNEILMSQSQLGF